MAGLCAVVWTSMLSSYETFKRRRNLKSYLRQFKHNSTRTESPNPTPIGTTTIFPFRNLALAGGGAKAVAYCGMAQALEHYGILNNIKKFAGTSAGAIVAALLSLRFTPADIENVMKQDMTSLLNDGPSGLFRKLLKVYFNSGVNPAEKFKKFMGDVLADRNIDRDITFHEVYERYETELWVVVTDVNVMQERYCSRYDSPNMPIIDALRISMSIPVVFEPVSYKIFESWSVYVDGGVLCNYPIHVFDKCYLSEPRKRKTEMFNDSLTCNPNMETLGCLVYSQDECRLFRHQIEKRYTVPTINPEDTTLFCKWVDRQDETRKAIRRIADITDCMTKFRDIFGPMDRKTFNDKFAKEEFQTMLQQALDDERKQQRENDSTRVLAKRYAEMLYGTNVTPKMIFEDINKVNENEVTRREVFSYINQTRLFLIKSFPSKWNKTMDTFSFFKSIILGLNNETMDIFFKRGDNDRTVVIDTWHITALDFAMEDGDRKFLIEVGKRSTEEFLKNFAKVNGLTLTF